MYQKLNADDKNKSPKNSGFFIYYHHINDGINSFKLIYKSSGLSCYPNFINIGKTKALLRYF